MAKDEWMRAAMSDDTLVVELLVRLKRSQSTAACPLKSLSPPLTWTVRMPRSKALRCDPSHRNRRHGCAASGDSSTRCSPTTPLSWSAGAASPSATGTVDGGFEEDSGISPSLPRSKGSIVSNHEIASATTSKRSRKKKTFSELKEEESLLLKEKVQLKKDLTKLRSTYKERRTENESLKRMKVELVLHSLKQKACDFDSPVSTPPEKSKDKSREKGGFFLLPDLNSLPGDEDEYCPTTS